MSLNPAEIQTLQGMLLGDAGILLERGKEYLIESRLAPIAQAEGITSVEQLLRRVSVGPSPLRKRVVEAMTTNETSFFRDLTPFRVIKDEILPQLARRRPTRQLRIWSAACSTGQEAVSLAITILDGFPDAASWSIRIVGTDVNEQVVRRARAGRYSALEANRGLPAPVLLKHFKKDGLEWEAGPAIRALCDFRAQSLLDPMVGPFDLVLLRNVLIYFSPETRAAALRRVRAAMAADGWLLLGSTEAANAPPEGFTRAAVGGIHVLRPT